MAFLNEWTQSTVSEYTRYIMLRKRASPAMMRMMRMMMMMMMMIVNIDRTMDYAVSK